MEVLLGLQIQMIRGDKMSKPGQPMTVEEQIRRDIIDYGDTPTNRGHPLNKYIVSRAKRELAELELKVETPKEEVPVKEESVVEEVKPEENVDSGKLTFEQYKDKTMKELKVIGKALGIPKYYDLKEDYLIKAIMELH